MNNIKLKTNMLEDLNKNLEDKVTEKTKELTNLIQSQKKFIKNSVHEINTPLSIIQTNIDLLKMKIPNNKYITKGDFFEIPLGASSFVSEFSNEPEGKEFICSKLDYEYIYY